MSSRPQQQASSISALNYQGLTLLKQGDIDAAIGSFRKALNDLLVQMRQEDGFAPEDLRVFSFSVCSDQVQRFADDNYLLLASNAYCFDYVDGNGSLPQAQKYEEELHQEAQDTAAETISACMLFNLGLSYQIKALSTTAACGEDARPKEKILANALKCYQMGLETVSRSSGRDLAAPSLFSKIFLLAVFNNQAHANLHKYDLAACSRSMEAVRYLLHLQQQGEAQEEVPQHGIFLMNLILFDGHEKRSAPAA